MKLTKFKVTNFRSVDDSGWVEVDAVTALIGVNESGKTNLLLPLWKLNPARDGEIQPTSDFPKTMFGDIRADPGNYPFVTAEFETNDGTERRQIAQAAGITPEAVQIVEVTRFFDGNYQIRFPEHKRETTTATQWVKEKLCVAAKTVDGGNALKQEENLQKDLVNGISQVVVTLPEAETVSLEQLTAIRDQVEELLPEKPAKTSVIVPMMQQLLETLTEHIQQLSAPHPEEMDEALDAVVSAMPTFVYYANYGNLDSEIYLPHVVENLERDDLGTKEAAKARTLRVLFSFVQLQAKEILELGRDFQDPDNPNREPNDEELDKIKEGKRTRSILLQSAGAKLTKGFKEWFKQGDYRFRFEADGNHFRIWVADDRRPTEVELESRSTGLQWFLSFYLVFLVESSGEHKKAVLLLDEPGLSLHPLAQRDLSTFFQSLSNTNSIIYTAHSPFLVDPDWLERARKVYVADDGTTKATSDLRYSNDSAAQVGAAYAAYSGVGLSVAESLLLGCQPVIVEGPSDQFYLTAIKTLLVSDGKITPKRELIFSPSGGTKTARIVASILTGRDESLPTVLLDGDTQGQRMAGELKSSLYTDKPERVLLVNEFVRYDNAEIEDLFPFHLLADEMDRMERAPETRLTAVIREGEPFVGQVEAWATDQRVGLSKDWKVKLAKRVKERALAKGIGWFKKDVVDRWIQLFNAFEEEST